MTGIEFNGLVGVLIFLVTAILLTFIVLIHSAFYFFAKKSIENQSSWSKYFLLSAIILLIFDGVFYMLIFFPGNKTLTRDEAIAFDNNMLLIWIPAHLIGYFFFAFILRFIQLRKEKLNKFIDKLR